MSGRFFALLEMLLNGCPLLKQDMNDFVYESYIQDSEYVVTGINWDDKLLSFKHTYYVPFHDGRGDFLQPIDCNYPGLSNKPGYAVTVGVYDFGNSRYDRVFHIYEAAKVPDECTDFNTSSTRLNDAKEYFTSSGIDYTNVPRLHNFNRTNHDTFQYERTLNSLYLGTIAENSFTISVDSVAYWDYSNPNIADGRYLTSISLNGMPFQLINQIFPTPNVGSASILLIGYYTNGTEIIILEKLIAHRAAGKKADHWEIFQFSRKLNID